MSTDGAIQTDGMNSAVGDAAGLDLDGSVGPGSDGSQSEQNDGGIRAADGGPADGSSDSTTLDCADIRGPRPHRTNGALVAAFWQYLIIR